MNVDVDVPTFLPLSGQRRLADLRYTAQQEKIHRFRIDGQVRDEFFCVLLCGCFLLLLQCFWALRRLQAYALGSAGCGQACLVSSFSTIFSLSTLLSLIFLTQHTGEF